MKSHGKGKLSLFLSACVSVLAVFVCSVSTFAWFQATANARIRSTSSSVNLSASTPDSFEFGDPVFYAYNGNGQAGYPGAASGNISDDENLVGFTKLDTEELKAAKFSISGLVPGRKMSFGIKITATNSYQLTTASLSLTGYTTTNNNYRRVLSAVTDGSSGTLANYDDGATPKIIRIEDIVLFHSAINTTGAFEEGSSSSLSGYDETYTSGTGLQSKSYTDQDFEISTQGTYGSPLGASTIYLFYTIEFSNDKGTWYEEYTKTSSTYHKCREVVANNFVGDRYFYQDRDYGSSSCYEGLSFRIDELEVTAY